MKKRLLALLLAAVMLAGVLPAFAAEAEITTMADPSNDTRYYGSKTGECVWYALGRYRQLGGDALSGMGSGGDFLDNAKKQGLEWGTEPRKGAIACWTREDWGNQWGHVAVVEYVGEGGKYIRVSQYNRRSTHAFGGVNSNNNFKADHLEKFPNSDKPKLPTGYIYLPETSTSTAPTPATIKEDIYTISPKCAPTRCLDVVKSKETNWAKDTSANVQIWTNDKTDNQQWKVVSVGDGYYKLVSQCSQHSLDVYNGNKKAVDGTNVQQHKYTASHNAQQWKFEDAGDGYYYIVPKVNDKTCLDVSGGNNTNGTNVQIWTKNQSDAQKWKLVPLNCSHSWGSWKTTKEANCGVTGQKTHTCSICGETQSQNIAALKHNYQVTNSTATKDTYTCANCGRSYDEEKAVTTTPKPTPTYTPTWGAWSGWSTTPVTASSTRQVETKKESAGGYYEYRYGRYMAYNGPKTQDTYWCTTYARNRGYKSVSGPEYTSWSTTRLSPTGKDYSCGFCKGSHTGVDHYSSDGRPWWHIYNTSNGEYYWEESRWVETTRTLYRYRDYK